MSLFINNKHLINTDIKRQCGILQCRYILWGDTHIRVPILSTFIILKSLSCSFYSQKFFSKRADCYQPNCTSDKIEME